MATFANQAATADRLIAAKGKAVTFTRENGVPGTFDPVTQVRTAASDLTITMNCVGIAPGKSAEFKIGSLIGRNLIELHCAPKLGQCPAPGDTFQWGGKPWKVIYVDELNPADDGAPYCKAYAER